MAGGWSKDGDVQQQIDDSVRDELERARRALPQGDSAHFCHECDEPIPRARREAIPGVRLCIDCQAERDRKGSPAGGFNRRGSKDSQLR
ncbi:DksA/TraR family C4-type zinc finger protein [Halomonas sp. I1]|uniref:DksA/TraR family C4-type zinc finger protein n=1 Tax=Halomonas sp. I1 TaxID=393536 RepID=UPI0028DFE4A3|nr:DksA/TraR family C4-type zinc finger protein [Halomonas sp. I1]MDT8894685.1 DksA/TraR family C4-type zinc finger protein [Halomonas sp. I1]